MSHLIKLPDSIEIAPIPFRNVWLKRIVVAGVLLLSGMITFQATETLLIRVLIVILGLGGLVTVLLWPSLGILGILVSAFFVSFTGPGGINAAVILVGGMTLIMALDMIVQQRKIQFTDRRTSLAIFIFILSAVLSFGIGQLPWFSLARQAPITAQTGGLAIFVLSGLAFLVVANLVRDVRWLKAFTWIFLFIAMLYILGRLIPMWGSILRRYFQIGSVAGSVFWIWMLIIPFSQALLNRKLPIAVRAGLIAFCGLALYVSVIISSDWKSGFLPPLAGAAFIVALMLRRHVIWFIPIGIALAIYAGYSSLATEDYSWFTRVEAWGIVLRLMLVNPLFGLGFGNYYFYTPLMPINGWHVNFNSHSQYVDILAQTGIFGLAAFGWVFWEIGKLGWRLRERAPEGFERAYVYGALGGLVGMLVAGGLVDWILPFVYNIGMAGFRSSVIGWLFLGGLVTIKQIVERSDDSQNSITFIGGKND